MDDVLWSLSGKGFKSTGHSWITPDTGKKSLGGEMPLNRKAGDAVNWTNRVAEWFDLRRRGMYVAYIQSFRSIHLSSRNSASFSARGPKLLLNSSVR